MALSIKSVQYAALSLLLLVSACSTAAAEPTPVSPTGDPAKFLTIGDISDEPKKKIDRFQPLADHLASNLNDLGYDAGRVVIAANVEEMIEMVERGEVDVYFDSPFPALTTQVSTGTELILRRWKDGDAVYSGVVVTRHDSNIQSVDDIRGRVVAAEEPYSTTGFAQQVADLAVAGYMMQLVDEPDWVIARDVIGIWFSRDEENTIEAVLNGTVDVGFLSDRDLAELPDELRGQVQIVLTTELLPRQIVSLRKGIDADVRDRISGLLLDLENTADGVRILEQIKTARFDEIPTADRDRLGDFAEQLPLLP